VSESKKTYYEYKRRGKRRDRGREKKIHIVPQNTRKRMQGAFVIGRRRVYVSGSQRSLKNDKVHGAERDFGGATAGSDGPSVQERTDITRKNGP